MTRYAGLAFAAAILAGSMQLGADQAISIKVRPAVTTFKGSAHLRLLVARDESNRELIWEVDGPSFYRSSTMQLDGAAAPRSYFFILRDLPAGEFEIRARVRRNDNSEKSDRSTIRVIGGPE